MDTAKAETPVTPEALEALRTDMLRFATMQLRDSHLAEDLVQDTMMTALAKASQFAGRSSLGSTISSGTVVRRKVA